MRERVALPVPEVIPDREKVLEREKGKPDKKILDLLDKALRILAEEIRPVGLLEELTVAEFQEVFRGEGRNDLQAPLGAIYPLAERLALFAVTLGEGVSQRISGLFTADEYALGYFLDASASAGADRASQRMVAHYGQVLKKQNFVLADRAVVDYSPGYCGWDLTGQKALFRKLCPEEIGITLNSSCIMQPLKTVSGVMVLGKKEIHAFHPEFAFCRDCKTMQCRVKAAASKLT
jgi:Vitamin B12 dependent methionine synthase, activation domain